jgi:hypothetical protein
MVAVVLSVSLGRKYLVPMSATINVIKHVIELNQTAIFRHVGVFPK